MKLHRVTETLSVNDADLSGLGISNCKLDGMTINGVAVQELFDKYESA